MKTSADSGGRSDAQVRGEAPSGDVGKMHFLSRPGGGMSILLELLVLDDIRHGRGPVVLDPHGNILGGSEIEASPSDSA